MKTSRYGILASIVLMIFGIILMVKPEESLLFACKVIGWGLIASGLIALIVLVIRALKAETPIPAGLIALSAGKGVVALVCGILLLVNTETVVSILPFLFGVLILLNGLTNVIYALLSRRDAPRWLFPLVGGALACVFGILVMLNPFSAAATLVFFMGLSMVVDGLGNLFAAATL